MQKIEEYILIPQVERQAHLNLDEDCVERGGDSVSFRGLLAYFLDTTIPKGCKIHMCHACNNKDCSNPHHLYWGTATENRRDFFENGGKNIWECIVEKYGLEEAKKRNKRSTEHLSKAGRAKKKH